MRYPCLLAVDSMPSKIGLLKGSDIGATGRRSITTLTVGRCVTSARRPKRRYPSSLAISRTRFRVSGETPSRSLSANDALAVETPAALATSFSVTLRDTTSFDESRVVMIPARSDEQARTNETQ